MPAAIRPPALADQPAMVALARSAHVNPRNLEWPPFVVAEEEGKIVGIGQVKIHRDGSRTTGPPG